MANKELGQYSVISYVNQMRGERINVGVVAWHPRFGFRLNQAHDLERIKCLDSSADIKRLKNEFVLIRDTLETWNGTGETPLQVLSGWFRHDVVVAFPLNARVVDLDFFSERLQSLYLAPKKFKRDRRQRNMEKRFGERFGEMAQTRLPDLGIRDVRTNFDVNYHDRPIHIAAEFTRDESHVVWRTSAFFASDSARRQLTKAKAIYAENDSLKQIEEFGSARLNLAIYSDHQIEGWSDIEGWLKDKSDRIITLGGRDPIAHFDPAQLAA